MSNDRHQFEQGVEAYLDDAQTDAERAAFEQQFQEDDRLQQAAQRQQQINASLKRLFAPPSTPQWAQEHRLVAQKPHNGVMGRPARAVAAGAQPPATDRHAPATTGGLSWPRRLAVAAAIALAVVGGWLIWQVVSPSTGGGYDIGPWQPPQQIYAALDEPDWVCESDEQFMSTFKGRLGQALVLEEPADGPTMAGLAYRHALSRDTICVLGSSEGRKIVVFVDRVEHDNGLDVPPDSGLHVHKRTIGNLVLYEVSSDEQPQMLSSFRRPAAPSGENRSGE